MKKIQIRLFDRRRNQNFWFHFCYIPEDLWTQYQEKFKILNMDLHLKVWLNEDFGITVTHMEDLSVVKECVKNKYSKEYPNIFLESESDRQGWTRVWLTEKIKQALEVI